MKKIISLLLGLVGISFVILIHETGHFLTAQFFGIQTPIFSIGFGPDLLRFTIGSTQFQIAALPLGGYVEINNAQLMLQSYWVKMIIILAGIIINLLFAYVVLKWFKIRGIDYQGLLDQVNAQFKGRGIIGPIGIISMISNSATLGFDYYLLALASLSFSVGIFNLLPVPFLDGGQLVRYTYEALQSGMPQEPYSINPIIFMLFVLAALYVILRLVVKRYR